MPLFLINITRVNFYFSENEDYEYSKYYEEDGDRREYEIEEGEEDVSQRDKSLDYYYDYSQQSQTSSR